MSAHSKTSKVSTMSTISKITENGRQKVVHAVSALAVAGVVAITALRMAEVVGQGYIFIVILLTYIALRADIAANRVSMAETIGGVFEAGLRAATSLQAGIAATACVIETDLTGDIRATDRTEAIGWSADTLVGQPADVVIPDRFLRAWQSDFRKLQQSGDARATSSSTSMQVRGQDGTERVCRMSLARLGDTYVATFVPVAAAKEAAVKEGGIAA